MMTIKRLLLVLFVIGVVFANEEEEEKRAREFLVKLNERCAQRNNRVALANWGYASNITIGNLQQQVIFVCL